MRAIPFFFLFFLSGATALVYEVVWLRQIGQILGHTSQSTALVVAAFMLGLGLGGWVLGQQTARWAMPRLLLYGLLELGIGLLALIFPWLLALCQSLFAVLYEPLASVPTVLTGVRFLLAFFLLLPPTFLMGGTLPVLVEGLSANQDALACRIGWLYGLNTLGAASGTLCAGFLLIPSWGLSGTLWLTAWTNVGLGLAALGLAKGWRVRLDNGQLAKKPCSPGTEWEWPETDATKRVIPPQEPETDATKRVPPPQEPETDATKRVPPSRPIFYGAMLTVALTGFIGLAAEMIYFRMFAVLFASLTYSGALLLAVFLFGLGLGGLAVALWVNRWPRPSLILAILLFALAAALLLSLAFVPTLRTRTGTRLSVFGGESWFSYLLSLSWDALWVLLGPTVLLGAIFPVACRVALAAGRATEGTTGRMYAANLGGALSGTLLTGFVLIPQVGYFFWEIAGLATLALVVGLAWLYRERIPHRRLLLFASLVGILLSGIAARTCWGGFSLVQKWIFQSVERPDPHPLTETHALLHYREGASYTISVWEDRKNHQRVLYTDCFRVAGTGPLYSYMPMLGHLPALLAEKTQRALVVGFGTGTTAAALPYHGFQRIDIVEIAPEVCEAAPYFRQVNEDILERERVRLILDDARHYLRGTQEVYDVITAEPLIPYLSGATALYSREFYRSCRQRLATGGVFCQWVPLHGIKPRDFAILYRTFADVFPEGTVWYFQEASVLLGSHRPLLVDLDRLEKRMRQPRLSPVLKTQGLENPLALLSSFLFGSERLRFLGEGLPVMTDDQPWLEYFDPRSSLAQAYETNLRRLLAAHQCIFPGWIDVSQKSPLEMQDLEVAFRSFYASRRHLWGRQR